jgi:hypothetical protein
MHWTDSPGNGNLLAATVSKTLFPRDVFLTLKGVVLSGLASRAAKYFLP